MVATGRSLRQLVPPNRRYGTATSPIDPLVWRQGFTRIRWGELAAVKWETGIPQRIKSGSGNICGRREKNDKN